MILNPQHSYNLEEVLAVILKPHVGRITELDLSGMGKIERRSEICEVNWNSQKKDGKQPKADLRICFWPFLVFLATLFKRAQHFGPQGIKIQKYAFSKQE